MLPMVVAGGLLIALSFVFGIEAFQEEGTLAAALMQIGGGTAFKLMIPLLAGYIAWSIADRPGLAPGMIGGFLAGELGAGFLGGIVAGFLAGYVARFISQKLPMPEHRIAEADPHHSVAGQSGYRPGDDLCDWRAHGCHHGRPDRIPRGYGNDQCDPAWWHSGCHDVL